VLTAGGKRRNREGIDLSNALRCTVKGAGNGCTRPKASLKGIALEGRERFSANQEIERRLGLTLLHPHRVSRFRALPQSSSTRTRELFRRRLGGRGLDFGWRRSCLRWQGPAVAGTRLPLADQPAPQVVLGL
jgi:hypothetical protein